MDASTTEVRKSFMQHVENMLARIPKPIVDNVVRPAAAFSALGGALTGTIGGIGGLIYAATKVSESLPQAIETGAGSAAALYVGLRLRKIMCDAAEEANRPHPDYLYSLQRRRQSSNPDVRLEAVTEAKRLGL
jgi:hypothetical protein